MERLSRYIFFTVLGFILGGFASITADLHPRWLLIFFPRPEIALALTGLIALGGGALIWTLYRRSRPLGDLIHEGITAAPDDLPPALAGYLLDGELKPEHIMAAIASLGEKGVLRIVEEESGAFRLEKTGPALADLEGYEALLMQELFEQGDSIAADQVADRLHVALKSVITRMREALVIRDLLHRAPAPLLPGQEAIWPLSAVTAGFGGVYGLQLGSSFLNVFTLPFAALWVIGLAIHLIPRQDEWRTRKGWQAARTWGGYRRTLRSLPLEGDQAARLVPYRIAFGEKVWWGQGAGDPLPGLRWLTPAEALDQGSDAAASGLSRASSGLATMLNETARALAPSATLHEQGRLTERRGGGGGGAFFGDDRPRSSGGSLGSGFRSGSSSSWKPSSSSSSSRRPNSGGYKPSSRGSSSGSKIGGRSGGSKSGGSKIGGRSGGSKSGGSMGGRMGKK